MSVSTSVMSEVESRTRRGRIIRAVIALALLLLSVVMLFPFVFTFTAGLKTSSEIYKPGLNILPETAHWENYGQAWTRLKMLRMFVNSFAVTLGGVFFQLLFSSLAAFSLSRLKPAGHRIITALLLVTLAIPGIAYIIPLYTTLVKVPLLNVSLLNSYWGLWLPYSANAFNILILKNFFDQIPRDIYDAAAVDGASPLRTFWTITLPLSRSILMILGVLSFIALWKDYLLPLLVLRDANLQPVTVRLFTLVRDFPRNLQMAAAFIAMLPPLLAAVSLQRFIKGGLTMGGTKG
ncbi:MAG TPA: carbohydrate ABC transporter permease [Herpetosiphonaceae bacterium]|nr:carbohydrate ABC transporter permease [Herpetosiphonaceae bacterium]